MPFNKTNSVIGSKCESKVLYCVDKINPLVAVREKEGMSPAWTWVEGSKQGHGVYVTGFKKAVSANQIKGLCKIYEGHKEWLSLFPTFLLQLSEGKYQVNDGSISSKSTL